MNKYRACWARSSFLIQKRKLKFLLGSGLSGRCAAIKKKNKQQELSATDKQVVFCLFFNG